MSKTSEDQPGSSVPQGQLGEPSAAQKELKAFLSSARGVLEPTLVEVLSDETRKAQRSLLLLSSLIIVVGTGILTLGNSVRIGIAEFQADRVALLWVMLAVSLYFEILVAVRCFTDWRVYRIKTTVADLDLATLSGDISRQRETFATDMKLSLKGIGETLEEGQLRFVEAYSDRSKDPKAIEELNRARAAVDSVRERRSAVLKFLEKESWFRKQVSSVHLSRKTRVALEVAFPLLFGAGAIVVALYQIASE